MFIMKKKHNLLMEAAKIERKMALAKLTDEFEILRRIEIDLALSHIGRSKRMSFLNNVASKEKHLSMVASTLIMTAKAENSARRERAGK